ncbi:hypothetical protein R1sor_025082 [Riccia sorocarpa]|uniref:Uncharacterized protein n=1 Tax=Riccia sorocarpa TaxID=122646 RepID=A0ABD3G9K1_9MARC
MRDNSQELVTHAIQQAIQEATTACEQLLTKRNEKIQPQSAVASTEIQKTNPTVVTSVPAVASSSHQPAQLVVEAVGKVLRTEPDRSVEQKMSSTTEDKKEHLTSGDAFLVDSPSKAGEQPTHEQPIVARTEEELPENTQPDTSGEEP